MKFREVPARDSGRFVSLVNPAGFEEEDVGVTRSNMGTRVMALALAAGLAAACQSSGGSSQPDSRGDFGREASTDPGMPDRGSSSGGAANIDGLQKIYFGFDKYNLTPQAKESLRHSAAMLSESAGRLEIPGNTDQRGTEEYNLALGDRRAQSAKRYLRDLGVSANITHSSMGEEMSQGADDNSWATDRRVDLEAD